MLFSTSSINLITGHLEEPMPNPMDEMTEEQKEYEAMKLVNMFDKLSRYCIIYKLLLGRAAYFLVLCSSRRARASKQCYNQLLCRISISLQKRTLTTSRKRVIFYRTSQEISFWRGLDKIRNRVVRGPASWMDRLISNWKNFSF